MNVPVKAYTAVRDHDAHFHQLEKGSGARIRYRKVSERSGKEVDADDIELGYEVEKGRYVTFEKGELDELRPESTRMIEVTDFVDLAAVDPIFYETTYWLAPDGDAGTQAYQLLRAAMEERSKVAIGTVVMRDRAAPRRHPAARRGARALHDALRGRGRGAAATSTRSPTGAAAHRRRPWGWRRRSSTRSPPTGSPSSTATPTPTSSGSGSPPRSGRAPGAGAGRPWPRTRRPSRPPTWSTSWRRWNGRSRRPGTAGVAAAPRRRPRRRRPRRRPRKPAGTKSKSSRPRAKTRKSA